MSHQKKLKKRFKHSCNRRGFSGGETIGEIKEMIDRLILYYSSIEKDLKFHIVEYAEQLLPDMDKM